jgi:AraC-like DNA-binding protein
VSEPLDFIGMIGRKRVDFRETLHPSLFPMAAGTTFGADRSDAINGPIFCVSVRQGFLETSAEELFDVGRIDFEERRFRAPAGLEGLISRFILESASMEADAKASAESIATLIVVDFLRTLWPMRISKGPLGARKVHPGVARARKVILREYRSDLRVEDLAKIANLSIAQFIAVFKQMTGKTPHEYLRQVRIENAARLLGKGQSIIDIGLSVGFASSTGFRSAFKKVAGVTPEAYRSRRSRESADFDHPPGRPS